MNKEELKKMRKKVGILIIALFIFITFINMFKTIPTGYVGVKTRFGEVQATMLNEGLNIKMPYIERIVLIDCRTQKCEYTMEASSKDLQKISGIKVAINYNVSQDVANQLYKKVGINYNSIIVEPAIYESIKQGFSQYTAEELITKRNEVAHSIMELLISKMQDQGIMVTALNIVDLSFSAEFDAAIEKKQITEQQTIQAQYELEKAKIDNEKAIANAEAQAKIMEYQNSQITDRTLKLKELEMKQAWINKWNGSLPTTMLGENSMALMDID